MDLKKIGFMNVKREDVLTRDKMRGIKAGSGGGACTNWITCGSSDACVTYDGTTASEKCRQLGFVPEPAAWGHNSACNMWC